MRKDYMSKGERKKYSFPADIEPIIYDNYLILVSPENANWIVLENQIQINIVKKLINGYDLDEIYKIYDSEYDIKYVLREIEGKHFYEKMIYEETDFTLRIYLTNRCNLRCKHCFMYADVKIPNELSYEEIIDLIVRSKEYGCSKVIFTGGEVCLKERFRDILKYTHDLGLYVQVLSNGTLWNDELIKKTSSYIDEIQISIDGTNEYYNSLIRGKGSFQKSLDTVESFSKYTNVFLSVVITPLYDILEQNKNEYILFAKKLVEKYGTNKFLVIIAKELIDGREVKSDINLNKKMSNIVDEIYEEIYPNAELTTFVINHRQNRIYKNCGFGGLTINSNGDYYFCGRIHDLKSYGNIRTSSFEEIMKNRLVARINSFVDNIEPCKTCNIRYICGGGCRISNVSGICDVDITTNQLLHRECNDSIKNKIYRLMIEANEFLYW